MLLTVKNQQLLELLNDVIDHGSRFETEYIGIKANGDAYRTNGRILLYAAGVFEPIKVTNDIGVKFNGKLKFDKRSYTSPDVEIDIEKNGEYVLRHAEFFNLFHFKKEPHLPDINKIMHKIQYTYFANGVSVNFAKEHKTLPKLLNDACVWIGIGDTVCILNHNLSEDLSIISVRTNEPNAFECPAISTYLKHINQQFQVKRTDNLTEHEKIVYEMLEYSPKPLTSFMYMSEMSIGEEFQALQSLIDKGFVVETIGGFCRTYGRRIAEEITGGPDESE